MTSYELRMTSYEWRMTSYEWRMTSYEIAPEPPKGDKPQKRLLFALTGTNDKLQIKNDKLRMTNNEAKVVIIC